MSIIYLLEPYSHNALTRLARTPKMYFCDTGLCAYLSRWSTPEALMDGAAGGIFFENYVVMELGKNFAYSKAMANIFWYGDSNGKEIPLMVECNGVVHPLDIKKSASPDIRGEKNMLFLIEPAHPGVPARSYLCAKTWCQLTKKTSIFRLI